MLYYTRYAYWKKEEDSKNAKESFSKLFTEFEDSRALWGIAIIAYLDGNCESAIQYLEDYILLANDQKIEK